jgi:7-cyano-7-deazaguanine synthase in queuosine biosynthesis
MRYLFDVLESEQDFEEVILFSGGLDSLGGAVREILQGHNKVVLVSHRPTSKILARQRELVARLNERISFSGYRPLHVAVEVNKGKRLGRDFNQRTRSFLFASVAAVVAQVFGRKRIRFYENGPISLNLPVSPQVLGGRASRTTHPRVLKGFERILKSLFSEEFQVQNPFLWSTKAELLSQIKGAGCGTLCALTSSCAHTWTQTASGPHCGRCSQCVDRRLAALSAGLTDDEDPPGYYRSNVLLGSIDGAELILSERYIGSLLQAEDIPNAAAFITRFPEVARTLRYLDEPTAQAAGRMHDLYLKHVRAIQAALVEAVRRHPECVVRRDCPINSLLGIVIGRSSQRPARTETGPVRSGGDRCPHSPRVLLLDRERFEARLGRRTCFLGNTKEFLLLERLNRRPGTFVSYDGLRAEVWRDERTAKNTIQRTVSNLRRCLESERFEGVLIDGSQPGHYRLVLPA